MLLPLRESRAQSGTQEGATRNRLQALKTACHVYNAGWVAGAFINEGVRQAN